MTVSLGASTCHRYHTPYIQKRSSLEINWGLEVNLGYISLQLTCISYTISHIREL
jgi:hypothetical protein